MEYYKELRKFIGHRPLILVGSVVLVVNDNNEILLQKREDNSWGLPGGLMDLGESIEGTARREVLEETGLTIGDLHLLGVFSGENYYFKISNGDEFYSVTVVFSTRDIRAGELQTSDESYDLVFFDLDNLPPNLTEEYSSYIMPYIENIKKRVI
ncbi:NUDIX hydrolase [Virgibacillus sp. AGTR]|nr:NUDIX hydrolase [Virgibacillus sp. AGTR]